MEKYKNIKNIILAILAFLITVNSSKAQVSYQKYDPTTKGIEYNIVKSQIESNKKQIELLNSQKQSLSLTRDSIVRSRIQGVISAKTTENFRLNQKAFTIMDANKIENVQRYNNAYETLRPRQIKY
jgi:hypothetical protein